MPSRVPLVELAERLGTRPRDCLGSESGAQESGGPWDQAEEVDVDNGALMLSK